MIVDSSAILAILFGESTADDLLDAILDADYVAIGAPTATETGVVLTRHLEEDEATSLLLCFFRELDIEVLPFTDHHWQHAIAAYDRFGKGRHPAALNFGDCMTYATAAIADEPLLCCGEDFPRTDLPLA